VRETRAVTIWWKRVAQTLCILAITASAFSCFGRAAASDATGRGLELLDGAWIASSHATPVLPAGFIIDRTGARVIPTLLFSIRHGPWGWQVVVPSWFVIAASLYGLIVMHAGRQPVNRAACEACGYPRVGLQQMRCPECGAPNSHDRESRNNEEPQSESA